MQNLNIPLILLNLPKKEEQVFLSLYTLYEQKPDKEKFTLKEISKLVGMYESSFVDILNKLIERNLVGKLTYTGVIGKKIENNFDNAFLSVLYNKEKPLESAVQRAGYYIDDIENVYVLNPVIKSWVYKPKTEVVKKLKNLKKFINNDFIEYLLKSIGDNKRKESSKSKWDTHQVVEKFRAKYKAHYGSDYTVTKADYAHMKRLLTQLEAGNLESDKLYVFFDYAFDRAKNRDYVLQIFGLKYYANEYLTSFCKTQRMNKT
jgi:hypothetical protein